MPSTYENIVPEYADFGDLSEDVFFPGEFDLSEFGNKSMPSVIWSNSGNEISSHHNSYQILEEILSKVPVLTGHSSDIVMKLPDLSDNER